MMISSMKIHMNKMMMKVINLNNLMIVIKIIINMKNSWSMISVNNNTKIIRMKK
jgi:hypothetical protein